MTKSKPQRFVQQEIDILTECIKANPENINKACTIAQARIKKELKITRSVDSLANKYQVSIKPKKKLFQIRGEEKSLSANVKNVPTKRKAKQELASPEGITQSILAIGIQMRRSYSPQYKVVMNMINTLSHEEKERLVMETFETL